MCKSSEEKEHKKKEETYGEANPIQLQLWVDQDYGSFSDCSSAVLIQPSGGFTGTVTVVEFIGFYDATTWTPNLLTLPAGL